MAVEAMESVHTRHDWVPVIIDQWRRRRPLSQAWNEGIQRAIDQNCDYILVSNDDVIYSPWTIDRLVEAFEASTDDIVMVTGCNNRGLCPDPIMMKSWPKVENPTTQEHPDFSCFMVRPNFPLKVGPFDQNLYPAYYEDNEMHIRINVLGYKAICTTAAPYYHYGSQTQIAIDDISEKHRLFNLNNQYLMEKWGTVDAANLVYKTPFNDPNIDPRDWKAEWRTY